jgi:hypothetical protein
MSGTRSQRAITIDQAPEVFNDACIKQLVRIGKPPPQTDIQLLGDGIREGARQYATEIRQPNDNEVCAEIERLYRAAVRQRFDELAILIDRLSPRARSLLQYREWPTKPSARKVGAVRRRDRTSIRSRLITLPPPEALRDHKTRDEACATVVKLCQCGGGWVEGRQRPSGKRSITWRPYFRGPERQAQFPKREAEQNFIIWLRLAWLAATGEEATPTADPRRPGPFARMAQHCLNLIGAKHADAVGLLNKLNQVRLAMKRRAAGK